MEVLPYRLHAPSSGASAAGDTRREWHPANVRGLRGRAPRIAWARVPDPPRQLAHCRARAFRGGGRPWRLCGRTVVPSVARPPHVRSHRGGGDARPWRGIRRLLGPRHGPMGARLVGSCAHWHTFVIAAALARNRRVSAPRPRTQALGPIAIGPHVHAPRLWLTQRLCARIVVVATGPW